MGGEDDNEKWDDMTSSQHFSHYSQELLWPCNRPLVFVLRGCDNIATEGDPLWILTFCPQPEYPIPCTGNRRGSPLDTNILPAA